MLLTCNELCKKSTLSTISLAALSGSVGKALTYSMTVPPRNASRFVDTTEISGKGAVGKMVV